MALAAALHARHRVSSTRTFSIILTMTYGGNSTKIAEKLTPRFGA